MKIQIIYANGTTTTAVLKEDNKVIKTAITKCHPDDTYDFESGARIAFDRLCNGLAESSKFPKVKEVKRPAKVGEYVKAIVNSFFEGRYEKDDILKVTNDCKDDTIWKDIGVSYNNTTYVIRNTDYMVLENYIPEEKAEAKPKFRPYLTGEYGEYDSFKNCGYINKKTISTDVLGNVLKVGDTVILYSGCNKLGEYSVVEVRNTYFISGIMCDNFTDGRYSVYENGRDCTYSIIKNRSYNEIENGEIINGVKYVLSE